MYDENMYVIEDWNNLIKSYNEMFNGIESALSNMTNIISAIGLSISIFEMFDKSLQKSIDNLSQTIGSLEVIIDGITISGNAKKQYIEICDSILNFKDAFKIDSDDFKVIENRFKQVGAYITAGIIHGMQKGSLEEESKEEFDKVLDATKKLFEIQSPSKVMERMGKYISEGLEIGIRKGSDDVVDAAKDLGDGIDDEIGGRDFSFGGLGAAFGVITAIGGAFTTLMSTNEEFGAAVDEVWTQITEAFAPVTEAVMNLITSLGEEGMGGSFSWFSDALNGVYLSVLLNLFSTKLKRSFIPYAAKL